MHHQYLIIKSVSRLDEPSTLCSGLFHGQQLKRGRKIESKAGIETDRIFCLTIIRTQLLSGQAKIPQDKQRSNMSAKQPSVITLYQLPQHRNLYKNLN